MQASLILSSPLTPCAPPRNLSITPPKFGSNSCRFDSLKANSQTINYSSPTSVFPAEACETIGGDACLADTYPEAKLEAEANTKTKSASEPFDREYIDYTTNPKTVLLGDACEVLGGEFCQPEK